MSFWQLHMHRDWNQPAEKVPVVEMYFMQYEESDELGFVGEICFRISPEPGMPSHSVSHRMRKEQFDWFVNEIAARYYAGGPK